MLGMPAFASADIAVRSATPVAFLPCPRQRAANKTRKQDGTTSTAKEGKHAMQTTAHMFEQSGNGDHSPYKKRARGAFAKHRVLCEVVEPRAAKATQRTARFVENFRDALKETLRRPSRARRRGVTVPRCCSRGSWVGEKREKIEHKLTVHAREFDQTSLEAHLESALGLVVIVGALQHVHVEGDSRPLRERLQNVLQHLRRDRPDHLPFRGWHRLCAICVLFVLWW